MLAHVVARVCRGAFGLVCGCGSFNLDLLFLGGGGAAFVCRVFSFLSTRVSWLRWACDGQTRPPGSHLFAQQLDLVAVQRHAL